MKFFINKNENGHEITEEIVMVNETLDVRRLDTVHYEIVSIIALALHMYSDSIKKEKETMLMIQNLMKSSSPWCCKSLSLRQQPLHVPNQRRK